MWLRQAFIEVLIRHHFDPERSIRIETDASSYAISSIVSRLTMETGQLHLIVFFLRKMIPVETWYKTHNQKLLAIVEVSKT